MPQRTVDLDADLEIRLKVESMRSGRPEAEVIREALEAYLKERKPGLPEGMGAFDSDRTDVSENVDKYLDGFGEDSRGDPP